MEQMNRFSIIDSLFALAASYGLAQQDSNPSTVQSVSRASKSILASSVIRPTPAAVQSRDKAGKFQPRHPHRHHASQRRRQEPSQQRRGRLRSRSLLHPPTSNSNSNSDVQEFHPWNPYKANKDIQVGDFYFKRKNYKGALDRYKEALYYKQNDAVATFRVGECEEKLGHKEEAKKYFEQYLKILPEGP